MSFLYLLLIYQEFKLCVKKNLKNKGYCKLDIFFNDGNTWTGSDHIKYCNILS